MCRALKGVTLLVKIPNLCYSDETVLLQLPEVVHSGISEMDGSTPNQNLVNVTILLTLRSIGLKLRHTAEVMVVDW